MKNPAYFNIPFVLENGEDYKTEFKQKPDAGLDREITAFANSSGGKIYIGITDDGKIKGINKIAVRLYRLKFMTTEWKFPILEGSQKD